MERGSDKHGSRLDDEMRHETEPMERSTNQPHTEEWRQTEPSSEDEPEVSPVPDSRYEGGTPEGLDPADVERRTEVGRHLDMSAFPTDRKGVLDNAEKNNAPDAVLGLLRQLPDGTTFENTQQVWTALGGSSEDTGHRP
ncbi:MAG TPA: DUF2795 domain-containing protein [Streptosporangiales bacterium]